MCQVYPREGCVRGLLQEGPGQAAPGGQVRLCRQREEYAQQTQGDRFRQDMPASRAGNKIIISLPSSCNYYLPNPDFHNYPYYSRV
jgi:hypothetical protein